MKCFIVLSCLVAIALALPVDNSQTKVLVNKSEVGPNGYKFEYKTSDGVSRFEEGVLENAGTDDEKMTVRGSVTWTGADGEEYTLTYTADEDGFHPEGKHLPNGANNHHEYEHEPNHEKKH